MSERPPAAGATRVSIRDVARIAGVHPSTVSRALRDPRRVSADLRQHVLGVADALGYRPNLAAQALTSRVSTIVPLLVPEVTNPFFAGIAAMAEVATREHGLHLMLFSTQNSPGREQGLLDEMLAFQPPFCVLTPSDNTRYERLRELMPTMAIVLIDRVPDELEWPSVTVDQTLGVRLALDHLYGLGHRAIACLSGPPHALTARQREAAYVAWVEEHELEVDVIPAEFEFVDGREAAMRWLGQQPRSTAVVAANDLCAVGFLAGLAGVGIRVPEDVSVVGFDGLDLGAYTTPPLTTVGQPIEDIGRIAVDIGLELSKAEPDQRRHGRHVLQPKLIVRASTSTPGRT